MKSRPSRIHFDNEFGGVCGSTAGNLVKTMQSEIQFVSDAAGNQVSVIVPIELWREIESERETAYLLKSATMKARLLEAKQRGEGMPLEEARAKLGI